MKPKWLIKKPFKVLSLFDGISCARVALNKARIPIDKYYASEICPYAIKIAKKNFHDTVHIGDIRKINKEEIAPHLFGDIDLLIGGSPCQDLSIAKHNRQGLNGHRSGLFWEYVRVLKEIKPKWFILENVASMPQEAKNIITKTLGVEPILINAALVSAQNRKRLFWTNIKVTSQPLDLGIQLKDILENGVSTEKSYCIPSTYWKENVKSLIKRKKVGLMVKLGHYGKGGQGDRVYSVEGKSVSLSALGGGRGAKTGLYQIENTIRKLTPLECERLQCLPDNYTEGISNTRRYICLGNAFNVDVVAHILGHLCINSNA